jgi:hypothetical protein
MAGFGKVSGRVAPRDAIDNEFFRWLTHWRIGRGNPARSRLVRGKIFPNFYFGNIGAHGNLVNSDVLAFLRAVLSTGKTSIERAMTQPRTPRNASIQGRNWRQAEKAERRALQPRAGRGRRHRRTSNVYLRDRTISQVGPISDLESVSINKTAARLVAGQGTA